MKTIKQFYREHWLIVNMQFVMLNSWVAGVMDLSGLLLLNGFVMMNSYHRYRDERETFELTRGKK